ncbi:MAG: hypothetical protein AAF363_05125 [Bacteroidota bacterium]
MTDFEAYLILKKIDPLKFKKEEPERWSEFSKIFEEVHPDSFTAQKLFLINKLRRLYHYKPLEEAKPEPKRTVMKPKMKPLPKK